MHASALENSRHTFQGLIDGAQSMVGSVYSAYRGVALSAMGGLQGALGLGLTVARGYASGTQNAAPGAALVGERGPELMFFRGGETVLNAAETRALRQRGALPASQALRAVPARGSDAGPVVQVTFQIEGSANQETVDRLREYGNDFAQRVIQVVENWQRDNARRVFS